MSGDVLAVGALSARPRDHVSAPVTDQPRPQTRPGWAYACSAVPADGPDS